MVWHLLCRVDGGWRKDLCCPGNFLLSLFARPSPLLNISPFVDCHRILKNNFTTFLRVESPFKNLEMIRCFPFHVPFREPFLFPQRAEQRSLAADVSQPWSAGGFCYPPLRSAEQCPRWGSASVRPAQPKKSLRSNLEFISWNRKRHKDHFPCNRCKNSFSVEQHMACMPEMPWREADFNKVTTHFLCWKAFTATSNSKLLPRVTPPVKTKSLVINRGCLLRSNWEIPDFPRGLRVRIGIIIG